MAIRLLLFLLLVHPSWAQDAGRSFLSTDYSAHATFKEAVRHSLRPIDVAANTRAVLTNSMHPVSPLRYILAILGIEAQKQIVSGEGLDGKKLLAKLEWKSLTLGYVGSQAGDYLGAGAQAFLGSRLGVAGGVAGFALRPLLWYLGSTMGQSMGRGIGSPAAPSQEAGPLARGAASALSTFEPVKDSFRMLGEAGGAIVGQALIPVPVVGACIGGAVGGLVTLLVAKGVEKTRAGRTLDLKLRARLRAWSGKLRGGPIPVPVIDPAGQDRASTYRALVDTLKKGDTTGAQQALEAWRTVDSGP